MYMTNLIPKNSPNALTFVFKAHKSAEDLYKKSVAAINTDEIIECIDDFDTKAIIRMSDIVAVTFSEYEKDMEKNGDLSIIQHKSQLKTQNKAKNDVGLRLLDSASNSLGQQ